ncbi:MAG: Rrf2 family transcriptional regulator, partial [Acidobacteriota bacterium]
RVLLYLAYSDSSGSETAAWVGTQEISDSYGISKNHLVRVIQTLAEYGYVTVKTGRSGGARLAKPPAAINLGDVVRHTEQSFRIVECFDAETNTCPILPMCGLRSVLIDALEAFMAKLDQYTLGDLCTPKRKVLFFDIMRPALAGKSSHTKPVRTRTSGG